MFSKITPSQEKWIIWSILILSGLFRLFINHRIELAPDEAYYWYWSKHLDLSYVDHPPAVAYLIAFFTKLGGNTEFFVRLGGFIFSILSLWLVYQTCLVLFPQKKMLAWEVLLVFNLTLLFSAGCIVQTPDSPLSFFWAAALYFGSKIIRQGSPPDWIWWGVALGFGLLSKYTMILIVPCTFLFLLFSPSDRFWLKKKEPYIAGLIALIIFSPVIFWNWQHHWISFLYQMGQGFNPERIGLSQVFSKLIEYVIEEAGVFTPLLFLAFMIYTLKGIWIGWREKKREYLYLVFLSWPILLFFGLSTARGKIAGVNWPAPAFMAGIILMMIVYHEFYQSKKGHQIFISSGVVLAIILNIMVHVHMIIPFIPIAPQLDPTQQFHGWRALGERINHYTEKNPGANRYFLLSDRATTVAEIVFYTRKGWTGLDFRQPERYLFLGNLKSLKGKDAIIFLHNRDTEALIPYEPFFEGIQSIGRYDSIFRNTVIDFLSGQLAVGKGFRGNWDYSYPFPKIKKNTGQTGL